MTTPTGPPVPFTSLPTPSQSPQTPYNAWSVYGPADELGFLNRQVPSLVTAAAASEIKSGERVSLNAALDFQGDLPLFGRQVFKKDVYQKVPRCVHDDTWAFNTQSSSQWDGLRHFGYQNAKRFYNDVSLEDVAGTSERGKGNKDLLGIQNSAKRGIVGRGVLVDFRRWMDGPGKATVEQAGGFDVMATSGIKFAWIRECLEHQGTRVQYGDVLVVRSGFMKEYLALSREQVQAKTKEAPPGVGGVEQSLETLQWIWEHFSAVAGDQPGFERWPAPVQELGWSFHEVLLSGWGCPIGELFDLEELSRQCEREGRWSFFFVSEPTNVPGGVASPPNALAIF